MVSKKLQDATQILGDKDTYAIAEMKKCRTPRLWHEREKLTGAISQRVKWYITYLNSSQRDIVRWSVVDGVLPHNIVTHSVSQASHLSS